VPKVSSFIPLILSLSKDLWFDKLTTSGFRR
jgi:hypothetical protein